MASANPARGFPLRVLIEKEREAPRVARFSVPGLEPLEVSFAPKVRSLGRKRAELAGAYLNLEAIAKVRNKEEGRRAARIQMRDLLRETQRIGRQLFAHEALVQLREWLRVAVLIADRWEVEADLENMIGLDLLPLGWLAGDADLAGFLARHRDLTAGELASLLPRGAWPVSRRWLDYPLVAQPGLPQCETGKVRVAFVGDDQCDTRGGVSSHMREHHRVLKAHGPLQCRTMVEDHWPDAEPQSLPVIMNSLARHLQNPEFMPRGCHYPNSPASSTHFFCHGDAVAAEKSGAYALLLGHQDGEKHHILTVRNLERTLRAVESAGQEAGQRSLIFLNACSVAEQSGIDHGSVVAVFAANRHPAIIGTETSLDVITAHRTTRLFYEHLLAGHGAAKALFLARRTLLDESDPFNLTPGALIYSCYGLPSACLKAAVPIRLDPDAVSATDMRFFFPSGS